MQEKAVEVRISGRVQGVNYRAWTEEQARRRGLRGWAQNMPDGTVEALFAGPAGTVDEMLALCREGPSMARVDDVVPREVDAADAPADFRIRR